MNGGMFQNISFIRAATFLVFISCSVLAIACSNQSSLMRLKEKLFSDDPFTRRVAAVELRKEAEKGNLDAIKVVLASSDNEDVYPSNSIYRERAYQSFDDSDRESAAIALGREAQKGNLDAIKLLIASFNIENVTVRNEAEKVLPSIRDPRIVEPLIVAVKRDKTWNLYHIAENVFGWMKDPRAIAALIAALSDEDERIRMLAAKSLGTIRDPSAVEPLIAAMNDPSSSASDAAVEALGEIRDPRAVDPLIACLKKAETDQDGARAMHTAIALSKIRDPHGVAVANQWFKKEKIGSRESPPVAQVARGPGECTCIDKKTGRVLWTREVSSKEKCERLCPDLEELQKPPWAPLSQ